MGRGGGGGGDAGDDPGLPGVIMPVVRPAATATPAAKVTSARVPHWGSPAPRPAARRPHCPGFRSAAPRRTAVSHLQFPSYHGSRRWPLRCSARSRAQCRAPVLPHTTAFPLQWTLNLTRLNNDPLDPADQLPLLTSQPTARDRPEPPPRYRPGAVTLHQHQF